MLIIEAISSNDAWRKTLSTLFNAGAETDNDKYYRDELAVIEIEKPSLEKIDPRFPMPQSAIDTINHFIVTGENEAEVPHEWTKLYYHRMFDEPHSQVKYLIQFLKERPLEGEALISMWEKDKDQNVQVAPCTEVIWGRVKHGKLEMHVHAHSSDAYKKLLMNIQEFIAVQYYVSEKLGVSVGRYYHLIDSCHIHTNDLEEVKHLVADFEN